MLEAVLILDKTKILLGYDQKCCFSALSTVGEANKICSFGRQQSTIRGKFHNPLRGLCLEPKASR